MTSTLPTQQSTLRSFPTGTRNCYNLRVVSSDVKYIIRASFLYGNYDGLNTTLLTKAILFDLHLGANLWTPITISDPSTVYVAEVLTTARAMISVCLVNTNSGTPFISSLELRPLPTSTYLAVNASNPPLVLVHRLNAGSLADQSVRYPEDPYDRIWDPLSRDRSLLPISTTSKINNPSNDQFVVPSLVMKTAVIPARGASTIDFYWDGTEERDGRLSQYYFFMHFAEVQSNGSRIFDIYVNGDFWYGPYTPSYLLAGHVYNLIPSSQSSYHFSLQQNKSSKLPPILNAVEVFKVIRQDEVETDGEDVDAIMEIKAYYQLKKNWMGDPCAPVIFAWDGLKCSYDNSVPPRIVDLNLSSSKLTGVIYPSLAKLKNMKTLDLSGNDLTGTIPNFLAELTSLQLLNLSGNQFSGSIPPVLLSRSESGNLTFSFGGNSGLCINKDSCNKKKISTTIAVILSVVLSVVAVLLAVAFFLWRIRRRKQGLESGNVTMMLQIEGYTGQPMNNEKIPLQAENIQFTFLALKRITKNFHRQIGRGGFGTVYHGCLKNGTQVAVKLRSQSSSQGSKEFITEAQVLTRVHHRNLVPLVGYCSERNHMALVYEYMPQGSLEEHLKGNPEVLYWGERLHIALETAQGLEYLHNACKPPIIHRDVKTTNILLNENLEAKIADFGLSKSFHDDHVTHVSTRVIGTRGYLDPEYYSTSQLTEKSDVYSFGVVLLELVTGQPAVLPRPEQCHIRQFVQQRLSKGDIDYFLDPRLKMQFDANSVWKVIDIAMKCTDAKSTQRPTMANVVVQIKEALELEACQERSEDLFMGSPCTSETTPFGSL